VFRAGGEDTTRFEIIGYPDWRRCIADGFSAELLIEDLAAQIATKVPRGPIRIIGLSLGGHLGYALGIHFQAMGREIAGLCAIDSSTFVSSELSAGWKGRALEQGFELLRERRIGEFANSLRNSGVLCSDLLLVACPVCSKDFLSLAGFPRFSLLIRSLRTN
jgi:thioesterase domain-containing protein